MEYRSCWWLHMCLVRFTTWIKKNHTPLNNWRSRESSVSLKHSRSGIGKAITLAAELCSWLQVLVSPSLNKLWLQQAWIFYRSWVPTLPTNQCLPRWWLSVRGTKLWLSWKTDGFRSKWRWASTWTSLGASSDRLNWTTASLYGKVYSTKHQPWLTVTSSCWWSTLQKFSLGQTAANYKLNIWKWLALWNLDWLRSRKRWKQSWKSLIKFYSTPAALTTQI